MIRIPFNKPYMTGRELDYIRQAYKGDRLSGDGRFTQQCHRWLEGSLGCKKALLTHSCTLALEMTALISDMQPGDEVIVPSYTFVSTANAFAMRGLIPVFVDVREDTLNIDERLLEAALGPRTRAICVVHYAGVAAAMEDILAFARKYELIVIEDAAQSIMATYKGQALGSLGDLATLSFHETKNITCGEGGAVLINRPEWFRRAEVAWEKGTDRASFARGEVAKYTWRALGSSFLPGELVASFLLAQLEVAEAITQRRMEQWGQYYQAIKDLDVGDHVRLPIVPKDCGHNAHTFFVILSDSIDRERLLSDMNAEGINAVFHYQALHQSDGGKRFGKAIGTFPQAERASQQLVRFPLWVGMTEDDVARCVAALKTALERCHQCGVR